MVKAVIYARYSSHLQKEASIEDQIRECENKATREGWAIVKRYADYETSGSIVNRDDYQKLLSDAKKGKFDIVLTESMERLTRDQEDIAAAYKRFSFAGVKIVTLNFGEINEMHIGILGTMSALFLKDLAQKTRRGQKGRVLNGKIATGNIYGYDVVRKFNAAGEPEKGLRSINNEQAVVIKRIFEEYATGISPKKIAMGLNKDKIPSPGGKTWTADSITGKKLDLTGLINNNQYAGYYIWNKHKTIRDPETRKRVKRLNPQEDWVTCEIPHLRIIDADLWDKTKHRQKKLAKKTAPHLQRRPKSLLANLLKCGCCGGGYGMISAKNVGCTRARKGGGCDNRKTISRDKIENAVLGALETQLMQEDLFSIFCKEYEKHMSQVESRQTKDSAKGKAKRQKLNKEKDNIIQAIRQGIPADVVKAELERIMMELEDLKDQETSSKSAPITLAPDLAQRYHEEVTTLKERLKQESTQEEAKVKIRQMVDKVVIQPNEERTKLRLSLYGDLAGMLAIASQQDFAMPIDMDFSSTQPSAKTDNLTKEQLMRGTGPCGPPFAHPCAHLVGTKAPGIRFRFD